MKRLLLSLLVLLMLTPGLACAKFMSHHAPQKQMADMPCCPHSKESTPDMGTMLFKDCMKVDLQAHGDAPLLKKPDIAKTAFAFLSVPVLYDHATFDRPDMARAPPKRRSGLIATHIPIFLATLRLRI